jgi:predicted GH43/DUF377 family glycosyl hydrolase
MKKSSLPHNKIPNMPWEERPACCSDNALLPFNRNGVLFPRRINGKNMMFSRPSDNGHTPFGDIYLSRSLDMIP